MGDCLFPLWEEAIRNTFSGMFSSFIKPMGILLAGCSSCRQVGISRDSNGRMGHARWKSLCTFTSERVPRKKRRSSEIKVGDWITIPKEYRPLLGTRANARSFDDRVGCAALVEAVRALGRDLAGRDVTFIWSTEEEVGLKGAAAAAERLAQT